jgi:hypothetical protein
MVEVSPPEGWQPPPSPPEPPTKPSAPRIKPPPTDSLPETAGVSVEHFDDVDALLSGAAQPVPQPRFRPTDVPAPEPTVPRPAKSSSKTLDSNPPPVDWSSRHSGLQKRKQILQVGAVVGMAAVAVILVVVLINTLMRPGPTPVIAETPNGGEVVRQPSDNGNDSASEVPDSSNDRAESPIEPIPLAMIPPAPHLNVPALDVIAAPPHTPPTDAGPTSTDLPAAPAPAVANLVEQFGDLNDVLDGGGDQLSMQELVEAAGPERGQIGIGTVFVRKPDIRPVDVAQMLREPIPAIQFHDVSLVDALRTISEITRIPICYELDLIGIEGISISDKLTLDLAESNVRETVNTLLSDRGLKAVVSDSVLLVTVADRDVWQDVEYDLASISGGDPESVANFVSFLQRAFARGTWQDAGGEGTIAIDEFRISVHQTAPVHALIRTLISKLDVARQLAANPDDDGARDALSTRRERSREARQVPVTLHIMAEQRLEQALSKITRNTETEIVVNWQALMGEGWSPEVQVPWDTDDVPLEQALAELTQSMQLAFRAVDERTLVITTHSDAHRQLELEIYPCADLLQWLSQEQLLRILDSVLGNALNPELGMSVTLESANQCWVAILPQPLQRRFEATLAQLRSDRAKAATRADSPPLK